MACRDVLPACPAEMLTTLQLKTGRLPVLMGIVEVRSEMFVTGQFPFKYGWFVCMACGEVDSWYLTTTGREVLPDRTVTVKDKTGSVTNKP